MLSGSGAGDGAFFFVFLAFFPPFGLVHLGTNHDRLGGATDEKEVETDLNGRQTKG